MRTVISRFFVDETGVRAIEYALIVTMVAVAIIAALTDVGSQFQAAYGELSHGLN